MLAATRTQRRRTGILSRPAAGAAAILGLAGWLQVSVPVTADMAGGRYGRVAGPPSRRLGRWSGYP